MLVQFRFRERARAILDQQAQQLERFRREVTLRIALPQLAAPGVDRELAEAHLHGFITDRKFPGNSPRLRIAGDSY
jgi:hypothetical protein